MPGSGIAKIAMSRPGATAQSLKGDYMKKVGAEVKKNVNNQSKSKKK